MLSKLAFVMQRLKKYLKNSCHDQQRRWGDNFLEFMVAHSCYEGDIELMGGSPNLPTRENPDGINNMAITGPCEMIGYLCMISQSLGCFCNSVHHQVAEESSPESIRR